MNVPAKRLMKACLWSAVPALGFVAGLLFLPVAPATAHPQTWQGPGSPAAELAVAKGETIATVRADGSGLSVVYDGTSDNATPSSPKWSSDGTWLAFNPCGCQTVAIKKVSGGSVVVLASDIQTGESGDWSPAGEKFLYQPESFKNFVVYDAATESKRAMHVGPKGITWEATWSPSGKWVAYGGGPAPNSTGSRNIYVIRPDGTGRRRFPTPSGLVCDQPSWSPNERSLAYQCSDTHSNKYAIYVSSVDGSRQIRITTNAYGPVSWSPNSARVVYSSPAGLFVANVNTGHATAIVGGAIGRKAWGPKWSPSGDAIAFNSTKGVYLVSPDGTRLVLAVRGGSYAVWKP